MAQTVAVAAVVVVRLALGMLAGPKKEAAPRQLALRPYLSSFELPTIELHTVQYNKQHARRGEVSMILVARLLSLLSLLRIQHNIPPSLILSGDINVLTVVHTYWFTSIYKPPPAPTRRVPRRLHQALERGSSTSSSISSSNNLRYFRDNCELLPGPLLLSPTAKHKKRELRYFYCMLLLLYVWCAEGDMLGLPFSRSAGPAARPAYRTVLRLYILVYILYPDFFLAFCNVSSTSVDPARGLFSVCASWLLRKTLVKYR